MANSKKKQKVRKGRGTTIKLVVKSNELVEARYMFDVWETRFFHSLIADIHKNDEDDKVYRLWFKDMKKNFQLKSNQSYDYLREAAISMASKSVYIGWQNDKFRRGRMHRIIRFVDFLEKGQKGDGMGQQEYVDVSIDKDIRPYLLDIKKNFNPEISRYTSYDLRNIIKLKPYAARLYELMKQLEYKGFRTIVVADLKDMFEITKEYPRFSNFYQKVILGSVEAINKHTDLTIPIENIEKIKRGRKVYSLRFRILSKTNEEINIIRGDAPQKSLFDDIDILEPIEEKTEAEVIFDEFKDEVETQFGMTASIFFKVIKNGNYSKENVTQAIAVTRRAKDKKEIKKTISGFFRKALEDGYTDIEEEIKKNKPKIHALEKKMSDLKDDFSAKINERIKNITINDEAVTLRAIEKIKNNSLTDAMIRTMEKKLGRGLKLDDYRKNERLRALVISNILTQEKEQFEDILKVYNPKIEVLKRDIKNLK
jgi:plasmid replication initiation protein